MGEWHLRKSVSDDCCEAATYSCTVASLGEIDSWCLYVFCLFSTILKSDFGQRLLKWHRNGWNSLLLATKEHLRHISVLLLLIDSADIPICHASQFNECKLRNQGMDLCKLYNAQHSLTIVISSNSKYLLVLQGGTHHVLEHE